METASSTPIANYISEGGKALEGIGVTPDLEIPLTREALLKGAGPRSRRCGTVDTNWKQAA